MTAESVLQAAAMAALRGDTVLSAGLNGVFAGPAVQATTPYAELGELLAVDWGVKDRAGRELRLAVTVRDHGDTPARAQALAGAAGAAIEGLARDLAGWRVAGVTFVRSRVVRPSAGKWAVLAEYRVRMMAAE